MARPIGVVLSMAVTDLPTARHYLQSDFRLVIWCKACRHQIETEFQTLVHHDTIPATMDNVITPVESSVAEIMAVQPDASVERLCRLLIICEKAQHRYQWASGFLLVTLMDKPDAPKKPSAFADWVATNTSMTLTQNEIKRRVTVYRFYSPFADRETIALIESGGIRIAYEARRGIDRDKPEQARAALQARVANCDTVGQKAVTAPRRLGHRQIRRPMLEQARAAAKTFDGQEWVPLALVIDLLSARESPSATIPTRNRHLTNGETG